MPGLFALQAQRQGVEQRAGQLRVLLEVSEHLFVGRVAAADVLEAGVFAGERLIDLQLAVEIPRRAMETPGAQQLRAVGGDAFEQAIPASEVVAMIVQHLVHRRAVDQVVDAAFAAEQRAVEHVFHAPVLILAEVDQCAQMALDEVGRGDFSKIFAGVKASVRLGGDASVRGEIRGNAVEAVQRQ
ncbi:hypothetical protein SRABI89_05544 [Pseudomonas koreensis]|nr:hypothetical protein SRABI89_05544 [Pseudomonas koreensis]